MLEWFVISGCLFVIGFKFIVESLFEVIILDSRLEVEIEVLVDLGLLFVKMKILIFFMGFK